MSFWTENKEISTLVHDTNGSLARLHWNTESLKKWLSENAKKLNEAGIDSAPLYILVEKFKARSKEIQKTIDEYYEKLKTIYDAK